MSRYDLTDSQLAALVSDQPNFRARQLKEGLYRQLVEIDELTVLPKSLRERLRTEPGLSPALEAITERQADGGQTLKWLFRLHDGAAVETVLMHYPHHSTVCVSSQAGCAMACTFCATGDGGYTRQLSTGEIVEQVVRAAVAARGVGRRLDHVVFMGMGEPFANFPRVWQSVLRIVNDMGLSARHVTLSTVGLVPQIKLLSEKALPVNLAVSLHAANNDLRDELVPINRRYPIERLSDALEEYFAKTHRRISFEWALIAGVNDRSRDVEELATIAMALHAHVNLIPLNPTVGATQRGLKGTPMEQVKRFCNDLLALGVTATIRQTRGREINAACGQLADSASIEISPKRPQQTVDSITMTD